jgi:Protein of unknown function (DUF1264)
MERSFLSSLLAVSLGLGCSSPRKDSPEPAGREPSSKSQVLEAGARALQDTTPVRQFDIYLVGFHPMKDDPTMQMEAHHYCHQVNQDFAQCVLFDGNTASANMNGVEYIISERLFESLPAEERRSWHPHNYEILSGQLVAPGLPAVAEKSLMKDKMNSYGKTWHVWMTSPHGEKPADTLPIGPPHLAWSFNRDGEAHPGLVENAFQQLKIDSSEKRKDRADLSAVAHPQEGVDALKGAFPGAGAAPPGVQPK